MTGKEKTPVNKAEKKVAGTAQGETLEELFAKAMVYGQITVSQTEHDDLDGNIEKGFYTCIQMWGETGIDLTVSSDFVSPTISSSLYEAIGKARKAKLLMAENA